MKLSGALIGSINALPYLCTLAKNETEAKHRRVLSWLAGGANRRAGISREATLKYFLWVLLHFNLTVVKSQYGIFYSYL